MNKNILTISICIGIAAVMILSAIPTLIAETNTSFDEEKEYTGPKEVYKETKKGNPHGDPPGQGNKPPKDDGLEPDPTVNKWAVVIGISDYRGKQYDLQYCDDDAQDMYNYLIAKGYPEGNIKLLLNGGAKAKAIMAAIDWLNSWENQTSEVVFFYSGHGTTYDGYDDGDTEYTDETIISADLYLILDGQLSAKFSDFGSQKISFTFDSCFSGGMDDLSGTGRVITTACGEEELSWETSDLQHGVFTYYFMEGLSAYHNVEDAYADAEPEVISYTNGDQHPKLFDNYPGNWEF